MTRRENLDEIFKDIEDNKKQLINPMLDNIAFLEERMEELKKLPFIQVILKIQLNKEQLKLQDYIRNVHKVI